MIGLHEPKLLSLDQKVFVMHMAGCRSRPLLSTVHIKLQYMVR